MIPTPALAQLPRLGGTGPQPLIPWGLKAKPHLALVVSGILNHMTPGRVASTPPQIRKGVYSTTTIRAGMGEEMGERIDPKDKKIFCYQIDK